MQEFKSEAIANSSSEISTQIDIEHNILKVKADRSISAFPTSDLIIPELQSCPFCSFVVNGPYEELHSHISKEHPEHFQYDQDDTFTEPTSISDDCQNEKRKHNAKGFKCNKCGQSFTLGGYFRRHLKENATCGENYENGKIPIRLSTSAIEQTQNNRFSKCEYCGMLVYSRNLKRHVKLKHSNGNVYKNLLMDKSCELCNVPFGNPGNLRVHMWKVHGVEKPKKRFKCKVCKKEYELEKTWERHLLANEKCRLAAKKKVKLTVVVKRNILKS